MLCVLGDTTLNFLHNKMMRLEREAKLLVPVQTSPLCVVDPTREDGRMAKEHDHEELLNHHLPAPVAVWPAHEQSRVL
jgi:hypothetical protein